MRSYFNNSLISCILYFIHAETMRKILATIIASNTIGSVSKHIIKHGHLYLFQTLEIKKHLYPFFFFETPPTFER